MTQSHPLLPIPSLGQKAFTSLLLVSLSACSGQTDSSNPDATGRQVTGPDSGLSDSGQEQGGETGSGAAGSSVTGDGDGDGDGDSIDTGDGDSVGGDGDGDSGGDGDSAINPQVGAFVENVKLSGYPRIGDTKLVNGGTAGDYSLDDLTAGDFDYALIHTATTWCPSCVAAADDLAEEGDALASEGVVAIELVLEGSAGTPPLDSELSTWVTNSDLTVATVRPGDSRASEVFPYREYVYVIELSTGKVVWAEQALFTNPTITTRGIAAVRELLK